MKTVFTFTLIVCVVLLQGCPNNKQLVQSKNIVQASASDKKPFDAMPREGWATDPNLSYQLYSYYPMDFRNGGFYQPYLHPFSRMQ